MFISWERSITTMRQEEKNNNKQDKRSLENNDHTINGHVDTPITNNKVCSGRRITSEGDRGR